MVAAYWPAFCISQNSLELFMKNEWVKNIQAETGNKRRHKPAFFDKRMRTV